MHNLALVHRRVHENPFLQLFAVVCSHLLEVDRADVFGHARWSADPLVLRSLLYFHLPSICSLISSRSTRIKINETNPLQFIDEPIPMRAARYTSIGHALIRAEVPVQMPGLLRTSLIVGQEATSAGAALVRLGIVESVDQFWPEDFERCG